MDLVKLGTRLVPTATLNSSWSCSWHCPGQDRDRRSQRGVFLQPPRSNALTSMLYPLMYGSGERDGNEPRRNPGLSSGTREANITSLGFIALKYFNIAWKPQCLAPLRT